jgi:hypothetical protein
MYCSARSNQRNSPLLRLPAELRNRIYHYTFMGSSVEVRQVGYRNMFVVVSDTFQRTVSLLLVCHQLYHEALSTFYELSALEFTHSGMRLMEGAYPNRGVPPAWKKYHRIKLGGELVNKWIHCGTILSSLRLTMVLKFQRANMDMEFDRSTTTAHHSQRVDEEGLSYEQSHSVECLWTL